MPTSPTSSTNSKLSPTKHQANSSPRCRNSRKCSATMNMSCFYNRLPTRSITVTKTKRAMKTNLNQEITLSHPVKSHDGALEFNDRWVTSAMPGNAACPRAAHDANVINFPAPVRGAAETELDRLKACLLQPLLEKTRDLDAAAALRRAGTEAAALAWTTPFPLLFLPALLDEKVDRAERYVARQKIIFQHGMFRPMALAA